MSNFPKNFVWGGATAAYQVEGAVNVGGRGKNVWDDWYHRPESKFNADVACDFYNKYPEDLQLASENNIKAIRISIAWSRIMPSLEKISQEGIDFYHRLIDECIKKDIEPYVTLHHFDSPQYISDKGDWTNEKTIDFFIEYAKICFKEYGEKVKKWITFNEPYVYNSDKFIYGECPPNIIGDLKLAILGMKNMMIAHSKTVKIFKDKFKTNEIGIVHVLQPKYPYDKNSENDIKSALTATALYSEFMLDLNYLGHLRKETKNLLSNIFDDLNIVEINDYDADILKETSNLTDFIGINYYNPTWFKYYDGPTTIQHNSDGSKGSSKFLIKNLGEALIPDYVERTAWDWAIYPKGLYDITVWLARTYPNYKKIYITENGIGVKESIDLENKLFDSYRIDYIHSHLKNLLKTIDEGVKVEGYFVWSLQDMFSWTNGYNKRYGLFYVDFETQKRFKKLSAIWYSEVSKKNSLNVNLEKLKNDYEKKNIN